MVEKPPPRREPLEYPDPITLAQAKAADDALFHRLVNADMRDMCHASVSRALRHPDLVDRWTFHLIAIKRRIEGQLARHKTTIQGMVGDQVRIDAFVAERAAWKTGAISMRLGAETRLAEARYLVRSRRLQLKDHIREHRDKVRANPDDSVAADERLWKVLDD